MFERRTYLETPKGGSSLWKLLEDVDVSKSSLWGYSSIG